ncbi:hypothetical protein STEG23_027016 [Scotinomys teguina]
MVPTNPVLMQVVDITTDPGYSRTTDQTWPLAVTQIQQCLLCADYIYLYNKFLRMVLGPLTKMAPLQLIIVITVDDLKIQKCWFAQWSKKYPSSPEIHGSEICQPDMDQLDSRLHTPMYFFLSVLSVVDLCYGNSIAPQMLAHLVSAQKLIPFHSCVLQLCVSLALGGSEFFLLGAMSYDRYVAVCHPLHYTVIMDGGLCLGLAVSCLVAGFLNSLMETVITFRLPLCHNVINHFACETLAVIRLACVDISFNKVMVAISGFLVIMLPCGLVLFSYTRIVIAILRIRSTLGRHKAFGTCASHLTVVCMLFPLPRATVCLSEDKEKMVALFYLWWPMLNPVIYSLRNKEVMAALRKLVEKLSSDFTVSKEQNEWKQMFIEQHQDKLSKQNCVFNFLIKCEDGAKQLTGLL